MTRTERRARDLAMCEGKARHLTRSLAQKAANRKGGMVAPYRCQACRAWHVSDAEARRLLGAFKKAWGLDFK